MIAAFFRDLGAACADLLWPPRCAGCERPLSQVGLSPAAGFCPDCFGTLQPIDPRCACPRCAAPLAVLEDATARSPGSGCPDCRRLPAALRRISAPYEYGGALGEALLRLKWRGRDDLALPLGRLLTPALLARRGAFDVVVPVPLHRLRLRQRGYNQATLLARAALRHGGLHGRLPLLPSALERLRSDPPARELGPADRFRRTTGAFRLRPGAAVAGQRVLLVDDVVTTGATALGCALALGAGGARRVEVLALLRAAP